MTVEIQTLQSSMCRVCDMATHRVGPRELEARREVVEGVGLGAERVLGARHAREQARRAVHAQLADVHVRLGRAHRPPLCAWSAYCY